jgi:hypothetical protein
MKKLLPLLIAASAVLTLKAQVPQKKFVIGIWNSAGYVARNPSNKQYYTAKTTYEDSATHLIEPSSSINVLKQDGFNFIEYYGPDQWTTMNNYDTLTKLVKNHGLYFQDMLNYWFKPFNIHPIAHEGTYNFNTVNNNPAIVGYNYGWLFSHIYNKPGNDTTFYSYYLGTEMDCFHSYPLTGESGFEDNKYYDCVTGAYHKDPDPLHFTNAEIPPARVSEACSYLKTTYNTITAGKIAAGVAAHGQIMYDGYVEPCIADTPYFAHFQPQDYASFPNVTAPTKPDIMFETSYYSSDFQFWATRDTYMGKEKNINYLRSKGYTHIISENDVTTGGPYGIHINPAVPNGNNMKFLAYSAILAGVDGVTFYNVQETYDNSSADLARKAAIENDASATRFRRANFSNQYESYIGKFARELRYLVNTGAIKPNNSNLLYRKLDGNVADPNHIAPAYSTYLLDTIKKEDARDYNLARGITPSVNVPNNKRNEAHGIQYIITKNNVGEAVMIVVNTNPYAIHNVSFNFSPTYVNDTSIQKANTIDVLFEDALAAVNAANYKTDTSASVTPNDFNLRKKYSIPFCSSKSFSMDFGPFDVHVLNFKKMINNVPAYANGWQNVWSNGGNNTIGSWGGMNNSIANNKFIPIDFNKDGDQELLCIQPLDSDGPGGGPDAWVSVLNYVSNNWSPIPMFTNNGNGSFNKTGFSGWGTHASDKYIVGDFDSDGYENEILCICASWAAILRSNPTTNNFDWIWDNGGNGYLDRTTPTTFWHLAATDKFVVGDFNNDGKNNDLLCIQSAPGRWVIESYNKNLSTPNFQWLKGNTSGNLLDIASWPMGANDEYISGSFDSADSKKQEILCMERSAGLRMSILKQTGQTGSSLWGTTTGGLNGWGPLATTNKILVGNIDSEDKDEIMLIQSGPNASYATTEDLNASNVPQYKWGNHDGITGVGVNYINDWRLNDGYISRPVNYLFIRPTLTDTKKYLLAFKDYGCGNYLINMYQTSWPTGDYFTTPVTENASQKKAENADFQLYPNPNNGSFTFVMDTNTPKTITIMDMTGRIVYEKQVSESQTTISLNKQAPGVYMVKVADEEHVRVKRMVIQ